MAKNKEITITVPKPCTEDWDKMTVNEQGRHCTSCNKTVIDFSEYTDRELANFFKTISGNVCGRLTNYQANRPIFIAEQTNRSFLHKIFFGTALASWLGITSTANAQEIIKSPSAAAILDLNNQNKTEPNKVENDSITFTGIVIDGANTQPIPFANIIVETIDGMQINGCVSNIDGKFILKISGEYVKETIILKCVYEGYKEFSTNIKPTTDPYLIKMQYTIIKTTMGIIIRSDKSITNRVLAPDQTIYRKGDTPYR